MATTSRGSAEIRQVRYQRALEVAEDGPGRAEARAALRGLAASWRWLRSLGERYVVLPKVPAPLAKATSFQGKVTACRRRLRCPSESLRRPSGRLRCPAEDRGVPA